MPRQISEIQSLPLHQIIGAPLVALVQGGVQAAQATMEFVQSVGFKTVKFDYKMRGEDGSEKTGEVEVPTLTLVPIPAIQVKDADIEFGVKITDIQVPNTEMALSSADTEVGDRLSKGYVTLLVTAGTLEMATVDQPANLHMKIKLRVEKADIPGGLSRLLSVMDSTIIDRRNI